MMTNTCPCPGGRADHITGELYCPWGAYGDEWTPEKCKECDGRLAQQDELFAPETADKEEAHV